MKNMERTILFIVKNYNKNVFEDSFQFALGACLASAVFFFSLAFGARIFSPLMSSRKAWQILDIVIAFVMFLIAYSMFSESF